MSVEAIENQNRQNEFSQESYTNIRVAAISIITGYLWNHTMSVHIARRHYATRSNERKSSVPCIMKWVI